MPDTSYMIGFDIGGTHTRIGAVQSDGTVISHRIESSRKYPANAHPVKMLTLAIAKYAAETPGTLLGVCIGFPGTVSKDKSTVLSCPNLPSFDGVNIRNAVQAVVNVPVIVEHEVLLLLTNDLLTHS